MKIELTKEEVNVLTDYIEFYLITNIRQDTDLDGINWLCNLCSAYKKLKKENE